jgi:hypothetical protein
MENGNVRQATMMAPLPPGETTVMEGGIVSSEGETVYYDGADTGMIVEGDGAMCGPDGCGAMGCNHCGRFGPSCGPFGRGCLSGLYVRGEYLLWGTKGADLPALITTSPSGTPAADAGVLGEPGTEILFGGESVLSDVRSGGRLTVGWWFDPCRRLGIEGDYFGLAEESESYRASSSGDPILARPFYDIVNGEENASFVAFPNQISGQISAEAESTFYGGGVRGIYNLCCGDGCGTSCITCCTVPTGYRFDAIVGYRTLRLEDRLTVIEDSTSLQTANLGSFLISDRFSTDNEFHGVDLGTSWSWCKGCFSVDLLGKIALGNTRSNVRIAGSSLITEDNESVSYEGGFLAQRTNIGSYSHDTFAVVPELGINVGYQINPCWRATLGYTFIYWSQVARAGDQIDRDLNPDLLPPEQQAVTTHLRPEYNLSYTDFWAQGLTVGLEGSW